MTSSIDTPTPKTTRRRRVSVVVLAVAIGAVGFFALRRMMARPMFTPGTVAVRIAAYGGSFDARARDGVWQVADGVTLRHDSFGVSGGEEVVFVHGGPAYPLRARPRGLEHIAVRHRVHVYDQRGCGGSTRPFTRAPDGSFHEQLKAVEGKLGLAEQIADIERIRHILGRERIVLVGHSFGGLVAALYAAEFPEHVRALVLLAPAPLLVMPTEDDLFGRVRARLPEGSRGAYDQYMGRYFDFNRSMARTEPELSRFFGEFRTFYGLAAGMPASVNDGDAGGFATLATYASLGQRHDWRAAMARITAPTVVVHGSGDFVPEAETRAFASAIPRARVVVGEASHFVLEDAPEAVMGALDDALGAARSQGRRGSRRGGK